MRNSVKICSTDWGYCTRNSKTLNLESPTEFPFFARGPNFGHEDDRNSDNSMSEVRSQ